MGSGLRDILQGHNLRLCLDFSILTCQTSTVIGKFYFWVFHCCSFLSFCLFIWLSLSACLSDPLSLSKSLAHHSLSMHFYPSIYPSIYLFNYLSIHQSIDLANYLSVYLIHICLSIYLSINLSIYLSFSLLFLRR